MAFRALRRTPAEIDEQAAAEPDHAASRRRFLTRAAAGGAIAVGASALLVQGATAQSEEGEGEGAPTGTTPGSTPGTAPVAADDSIVEGNDLVLVVTLEGIELAVVECYQAMVDTGRLSESLAQTARTFTHHHVKHAEALGELAGSAGATEPNARLVGEVVPLMEAEQTETGLVTIAYNLEETLAATYASALGELESFRASAVASKILPVDSQHAIAWSQVMEPNADDWAEEITRWIPDFQSQSGAIDLEAYAAS